MTMITEAIVRNRKIEVDAPPELADGDRALVAVSSIVDDEAPSFKPGQDSLSKVIGICEGPADMASGLIDESSDPWAKDPLADVIGTCEGPADLAENHDHYLYDMPKRTKS